MQTSQSENNLVQGTVILKFSDNAIATIQLGSEKEAVVPLTIERLTSLQEAIQELKRSKPRGLIITGSSDEMFSTGIDCFTFGEYTDLKSARQLAEDGQELYHEISSLPFPTIAVISGPCFGAALELALSCKFRLASEHKSTLLGFKECELGLIPCFGGTQMLPQRAGVHLAVEMLASGRLLSAQEALNASLVDEVISCSKMMPRAEAFALGEAKLRRKKLNIRNFLYSKTSAGRKLARKSLEKTVSSEPHHFVPAPLAAWDTVFFGMEKGLKAGLGRERDEFSRLASSPESKALIRLACLGENAQALSRPAQDYVQHTTALVVGAGQTGSALTALLASKGCQVILKDTNEDILNKSLESIRFCLSKTQNLNDTERSFAINRIETTIDDSPNLSSCNFALESVNEDSVLKKKVLAELLKSLPQDAIIGTSTTTFSVTEIASSLDSPGRVIGLHFFAPVSKVPLAEIIRGEKTSNRAIAITAALTAKLGKLPIIVDDKPGYLINRVLYSYLLEAVQMVIEGYKAEDIEIAAKQFGFGSGPLMILDEIGLDVAAQIANSLNKAFGERFTKCPALQTLSDKGRKGKKSGVGFYNYAAPTAIPASDLNEVLSLKTEGSLIQEKRKIIDRLVFSMINEAIRCLDESVAGNPGPEAAGQIDLGSVHGFGFPDFRGGVLHYAQSLGSKAVLQKMLELEKSFGQRFSPCLGLRSRADKDSSFKEAA